MNRIVIHESGWNAWAIHINGSQRLARQPATHSEAVVTARWLIDHAFNVDLGLGQLNVRNLSRLGLSLAEALDPCKNLNGSAAILTAAYRGALAANSPQPVFTALSYYNTGSPIAGFQNGYVQAIAQTPDVPPIPLIASVPRKVAHEQLESAVAPNAPAIQTAAWDVFAAGQNINVYESSKR